jgi:uncharacterized Zn-binding protein involved in type VI secretion
MSLPVAVLNTTSSHGGHMITASGTKFVTPQGDVCLQGDSHSCPIAGHGITPIVSGCSTKSTISGTPVALSGSVAGCGAVLDGAFASNWSLT